MNLKEWRKQMQLEEIYDVWHIHTTKLNEIDKFYSVRVYDRENPNIEIERFIADNNINNEIDKIKLSKPYGVEIYDLGEVE
jgi:hypothetical protein